MIAARSVEVQVRKKDGENRLDWPDGVGLERPESACLSSVTDVVGW